MILSKTFWSGLRKMECDMVSISQTTLYLQLTLMACRPFKKSKNDTARVSNLYLNV